MAYDEVTAQLVRENRELRERSERILAASRVLAEFAKTAPGRLPSRVQEALAVVDAPGVAAAHQISGSKNSSTSPAGVGGRDAA